MRPISKYSSQEKCILRPKDVTLKSYSINIVIVGPATRLKSPSAAAAGAHKLSPTSLSPEAVGPYESPSWSNGLGNGAVSEYLKRAMKMLPVEKLTCDAWILRECLRSQRWKRFKLVFSLASSTGN